MNEHQVIARKWRPQTFADVVGQGHVIRTLRNAIVGNRVGHAYLLVGPRGIGKTTIARIFAKAINCEHPHDGEPCCQCPSCKAIAEESSLDVIEVDAASRNSVDHMRALSEEAFHMPVSSKYKIYIIDEVHMLSKAAWNALLKTVEEPPAHVKFIFATTEAHQVLPTIVSRCQRFDLRPIPGNLILERLKLIAATEEVKIAPEALSAIARAAEGGMRDAQSSLEQMLAFFGGKDQEIAAEQVLELFGLSNAAELDALVAALLENRPEPVITIISQLATRGRNLETLFDDILEMLRGAELALILRNPEAVLEFDPEKMERCRKLAALTTPAVLRSFMESLAPVGRTLHEALNKAVYLESILLKAMHDAHAPTVGDVLARLNQLRTAGELKFMAEVPTLRETPPARTMPAPAPAPAPAPEAVRPEPVLSKPAPQPVPEIKMPEVAPPEPANVNSESRESAAETLLQKLAEGALNRGLTLPWENCRALDLEHSVLSLRVPGNALPEFNAAKLQLLEILQKISGDWAILLEFTPDPLPGNAAEDAAEDDPPPVAPEAAVFAPVETSAVKLENDLPEPEAVVMPLTPETEEIEEPDDPGEPDARDEAAEFSAPGLSPEPELELGLEPDTAEPPPMPMPNPGKSAATPETVTAMPTKRSVINKADEVEATAKLKPVRMVLDLFDGEIVDIHA